MNRTPPTSVIKKLRKEVRFSCPVPDCGNPVLTWHHFDPPWCDQKHHNPDGMIALCTYHHPLADGGNWTRSELRSFKENPPNVELIRKKFLWSDSKVLYRLGGNYAANCQYILTISGTPIVWHTTSPDGRILFNMDIRDQEDSRILFMEENCLSTEYANLDDLSINTYENHFKIEFGEPNVGLELRLRHLTLDELSAKLEKDAKKALLAVRKMLAIDLPDTAENPIVRHVLDFAERECLNSDNKIAVLDLVKATLFSQGRCIKIKDGIVAGAELHCCFSADNGGAAFAF